MSDATTAPDSGHGDSGHHEDHSKHYIKIWGILLVLLVASIIGPELGHPTVTLITAFGIAFVKAYLVIKHFMHLTVEKRYIGFLMLTMLAFMLVFVAGVAPDVMKHEGQRWTNDAAKAAVEKGLKAHPPHHAGEPADQKAHEQH